jgi:cytochrome c peroxidase
LAPSTKDLKFVLVETQGLKHMNLTTQLASERGAIFMPSKLQALSLFVATASLAALALVADPVSAAAPAPAPAPAPGVPAEPAPVPEGLKGVPVPEPSNINEFVMDRNAAIRLGKALFWDMQVGSDGQTACASCHFHAGVDTRSRNQVSPGILRKSSPTVSNPDFSFQVGGPNYQFKAADFPFHKFADPNNQGSAVVRTHNDAASSMGVFNTNFVSATPGAIADTTALKPDPIFQLNGLQTRRVEPRNTPSFINSVFNFRNFYDGRATFLFNGVSPFGAMDANARVYKTSPIAPTTAAATTVRIDKASLASLATGPVLSNLEMSADGRSWPEVGKRLLAARPLVQQKVHLNDSSLAVSRHTSGVGLNGTYLDMVKAAFRPEWWQATNQFTINGKTYTQAQANFSLFFGLAIQLYGATQVSDDSPFDRHMIGITTAMSNDAKLGMAVFFGKGECAACHAGAEFTTAATRKILKDGPLSRMIMGDGNTAVYDEGFYNTAVRQTLEDIANGERNPVNLPMATAKLAQEKGSAEFQRLIGVPANLVVAPGERLAINGAFKTPGLRNIEMQAPFFHNGDSLTLEQTVEFYNRGGNHARNNMADLDADIKPLGLTADEQRQLVAFMKALTDERVLLKKAPFDHPELRIPEGPVLGANGLPVLENGRAKETFLTLPAIGRDGMARPQPNFLDTVPGAPTGPAIFSLTTQETPALCFEPQNRFVQANVAIVMANCDAVRPPIQLWEQVASTGGFMLKNRASALCIQVAQGSTLSGQFAWQTACTGAAGQVFNWDGPKLVARHSGQCMRPHVNLVNGIMVQSDCVAPPMVSYFAKR